MTKRRNHLSVHFSDETLAKAKELMKGRALSNLNRLMERLIEEEAARATATKRAKR